MRNIVLLCLLRMDDNSEESVLTKRRFEYDLKGYIRSNSGAEHLGNQYLTV